MKYTIAALVFLLPAACNADAPDAKPSFAKAEELRFCSTPTVSP